MNECVCVCVCVSVCVCVCVCECVCVCVGGGMCFLTVRRWRGTALINGGVSTVGANICF